MANFTTATEQFLSWAGGALVIAMALAWRSPRNNQLILLYAASALSLDAIFATGDGGGANIFFDAAIALSLSAGLALARLPKRWIGPVTLFAAAPLGLYLPHHYARANFPYTEAFGREAPLDIGFIEVHPGPALCENLTLCFWAGKEDPVDVFNLSQAIKTSSRGDGDLAHLLESKYFGSVALSSLQDFPLGPRLKTVLLQNYRVMHQDDNGIFLERRPATLPNRQP